MVPTTRKPGRPRKQKQVSPLLVNLDHAFWREGLAGAFGQILASRGDPLKRARCLAQLATAAKPYLDIGQLEAKLESIEQSDRQRMEKMRDGLVKDDVAVNRGPDTISGTVARERLTVQ
jgi:hypothetical protein